MYPVILPNRYRLREGSERLTCTSRIPATVVGRGTRTTGLSSLHMAARAGEAGSGHGGGGAVAVVAVAEL